MPNTSHLFQKSGSNFKILITSTCLVSACFASLSTNGYASSSAAETLALEAQLRKSPAQSAAPLAAKIFPSKSSMDSAATLFFNETFGLKKLAPAKIKRAIQTKFDELSSREDKISFALSSLFTEQQNVDARSKKIKPKHRTCFQKGIHANLQTLLNGQVVQVAPEYIDSMRSIIDQQSYQEFGADVIHILRRTVAYTSPESHCLDFAVYIAINGLPEDEADDLMDLAVSIKPEETLSHVHTVLKSLSYEILKQSESVVHMMLKKLNTRTDLNAPSFDTIVTFFLNSITGL